MRRQFSSRSRSLFLFMLSHIERNKFGNEGITLELYRLCFFYFLCILFVTLLSLPGNHKARHIKNMCLIFIQNFCSNYFYLDKYLMSQSLSSCRNVRKFFLRYPLSFPVLTKLLSVNIRMLLQLCSLQFNLDPFHADMRKWRTQQTHVWICVANTLVKHMVE